MKLFDHSVGKFVCKHEVIDSSKVSVLFSSEEAYTFGSMLGWLFLREDLNMQEEKAIGLTMHRLIHDQKSIRYDHFSSICSYCTVRGKHSPRFKPTDQYLKPTTKIFQRQIYRGIRSTRADEKGMLKRYAECLERSISRNKYRTRNH